jgi:hypothetical protein
MAATMIWILARMFEVGELCLCYGKLAKVDDYEPYYDGTDDKVLVTTLYDGRQYETQASSLSKLGYNSPMQDRVQVRDEQYPMEPLILTD